MADGTSIHQDSDRKAIRLLGCWRLGRTTMAPSLASDAGAATPVAPTLKTKKSLDWISKSFKRKSSAASVASSSSDSSSGTGAGHQQQQPYFPTKRDRELQGSAANRVKYGGEPLLSIPGSPALAQDGSGWSRPASSQGGDTSDTDARSQYSAGSSPRHGTMHRHTIHGSRSPMPSPTNLSVSTTPVIPVTLRETTRQVKEETPKPYAQPAPTSTTELPAPSHLNGSTSRVAKRSSSDYEQLLVHLSSRKALRTMLDEYVNISLAANNADRDLTNSPVGLWKFGQFMASEMNAETLVFWLNVSDASVHNLLLY